MVAITDAVDVLYERLTITFGMIQGYMRIKREKFHCVINHMMEKQTDKEGHTETQMKK